MSKNFCINIMILLIFATFLFGFLPISKLNKTHNDIKYDIVEIEGQKFIATRSAYSYITLAGPVSKDLKPTLDKDSIKYDIMEIEGQKFIVTGSAYGHITLAGPID